MIVSASYRTDIPAFYAAWFRQRLAAGWCRVRNPYGGAPYRVGLTAREVDGFVFWTRNAEPFLDVLDAVRARGTPFVVQFTLTGYPRPLEPSVIDPERALGQVDLLARRFGRHAVVWRYDPVFVTDLTGRDWHTRHFAALCARLRGTVDEVVLSFAHIYRKTRRNTDRAAARHGFAWRDPAPEEKRALLDGLAGLALDAGMTPTLCAQPDLLTDGLAPARCVDADRLSRVADRPVAARAKGNRPGCLCVESRDIGAYDSCPHGCVYCYAVRAPAAAKAAFRRHDPEADSLG